MQERKEAGTAPPLPPPCPRASASLSRASCGSGKGQARCSQLLSLASNVIDLVLGPSCCLQDWGGGVPGLGGDASRKQWRDFPGQWGPCEEAWLGEKGEFSRPTSHRTDQPAWPGPDLPQFVPKGHPPQLAQASLPERRSRDLGREAEEV